MTPPHSPPYPPPYFPPHSPSLSRPHFSPASDAIRITKGRIIDPVHQCDGDTRDILIHQGKIVDALPDGIDPTIIDAQNRYVLAGGIEMHSHLASMPVNTARSIQSGAGYDAICPTAPMTGKLYGQLGYTTAIEAAVPPAAATFAHMQLDDMPNLDTGMLVLLGNHEAIIDRLENNDRPGAIALVGELLHRAGAYGIKAVNPAAVAAWRRDPSLDRINTIDDTASGSTVSPRVMLELFTEAQEHFALPHPTHIHGPQLGEPGNVDITLAMLNALAGRRCHLAHLQYYCYGKNENEGYQSAVEQILNHLRDHPQVTADLGLVAFGPAFTATADLPLEFNLYRHIGAPTGGTKPAFFLENGNEDCFGIMPMIHAANKAEHAMQWATGLELALLADHDMLWQLSLTIDHPNGGSFLNYPSLIAQLMCKSRRDAQLADCHKQATNHTSLGSVDRELTLYEIAILSRAAPARALGLTNAGHLGHGAKADLTIYDDKLDDPESMFAHPWCVIKAGQPIVTDAKEMAHTFGQRLHVPVMTRNPKHDREHGQTLLNDWITKHSTIDATNYGINATRRQNLTEVSP